MTDTLASIRAQLAGYVGRGPAAKLAIGLTRDQWAEVMAALEAVQWIELLRSDFGAVTVLPDDDEASLRDRQMAVECAAGWTGWMLKRFYGENLHKALAAAVADIPQPPEPQS